MSGVGLGFAAVTASTSALGGKVCGGVPCPSQPLTSKSASSGRISAARRGCDNVFILLLRFQLAALISQALLRRLLALLAGLSDFSVDGLLIGQFHVSLAVAATLTIGQRQQADGYQR